MRHCTAAKSNNEKALRVMQTLRALAVVRRSQKFSPRRRLPSEGVGRPKFNQLEMVTTFTYRSSLVRIDALHAISSYRGNRPTNTHTKTNSQTGPITIYCTAKLSAQCNNAICRIQCMLTVYDTYIEPFWILHHRSSSTVASFSGNQGKLPRCLTQ